MNNGLVVLKRTFVITKVAVSFFVFWLFNLSNDLVKSKLMNELTAKKLENTHESYALPELVNRVWDYSGIILIILIILMFANDIIELIAYFKENKEIKE